MGNVKKFVLWSLLFILCIMILIMSVYIADAVSELPRTLSGKINASIQNELKVPYSESSEEGDSKDGFPFTVIYRDGKLCVTDSSGKTLYSVEMSVFFLPERERSLLMDGITFNSMEQVWTLIESYTG